MKHPLVRNAVIVVAAAIAAVIIIKSCSRRVPDDEDYLKRKARELKFDRAAIVKFVKEEVTPESYDGALRGALGTLWNGAGNDADRALLLEALLDRSNLAAKTVKGKTWGVVLEKDGSWVGPGDPEPGAAAGDPPDACLVVLELIVTTDAGARTAKLEVPSRQVSLLDVEVLFEKKGDRIEPVLRAGPTRLNVDADASKARRLDLRFTMSGTTRTRELFTTEFPGYPGAFHENNRYTVVMTAGWIPDDVRVRETKRTTGMHLPIAWSFLARSDEYARKLAAGLGVRASFRSPRVTIVATEFDPAGGPASVSLDLRKNDIHVEGPTDACIAFHSARSLFDSSLESAVLTEITGRAAVSAVDLITQAWEGRASTLVERQVRLQATLRRLVSEAPEGGTIAVGIEGTRQPRVRFVKKKGKVESSLGGEAFGEEGVERAAQEAEVALAAATWAGMNCRHEYEWIEPAPKRWFEGSRLFYTSGAEARLSFEEQYRVLEPGIEIDAIDYYDDVGKQWHDRPVRGVIAISKEDVEAAPAWTWWFRGTEDRKTGRTWNMLPRRAYRELVAAGETTIDYIDYNDVQQPMKIYLLSRDTLDLDVNNRRVKVPILSLWGDLSKNNPARPAPGAEPPDRSDNGITFNRFTIFDDPDYPISVNWSMFAQSVVPGRVVDAATKRGIPGAKFTVTKPGLSALTWPDGRFTLPFMKEPFAEFDITVEAPGYEPFAQRIDFRNRDAFPMAVELTPLPRVEPFTWLTLADAETVLPGLPLDDHSRDLIRRALRERPGLAVAVPRFPVYADYGPVDAWLEVSVDTGESLARLSDGLYGATAGSRMLLKIGGGSPYQLQHHAISYFSGRIASWYLFAAGALESVSQHMDNPKMTLKEMHRHAISRAREMAKIYDGWALEVPGNPVVKNGAFKKGLKDGLDWAEKFYGEAWKD